MKILYDTKNGTIRNLKEDSNEINLTNNERRILSVLSNCKENSWDEIIKFVYGEKYNKKLYNSLRCLVTYLKKKTNLNIKTLHKYGLILTDNIFIK